MLIPPETRRSEVFQFPANGAFVPLTIVGVVSVGLKLVQNLVAASFRDICLKRRSFDREIFDGGFSQIEYPLFFGQRAGLTVFLDDPRAPIEKREEPHLFFALHLRNHFASGALEPVLRPVGVAREGVGLFH